jgi:hypothetical protein
MSDKKNKIRWVPFMTESGLKPEEHECLVRMNDSGASFPQIALHIEKNY